MFVMVGLKSQAGAGAQGFRGAGSPLAAGARGLCHFGGGGFPAEMRRLRLTALQDFIIRDLTAAANVENVKTTLILRVSKYEPGVPIP